MTTLLDYSNPSLYSLSVEANGDGSIFNANDINCVPNVSNSYQYDPNDTFTDFQVSGSCDYKDLVDALNDAIESNDFCSYTQPSIAAVSRDTCEVFLEPDTTALALNNCTSTAPVRSNYPDGKSKSRSPSILLSHSVGVSAQPPVFFRQDQLEIVHDLESTFRPRYKSDYFGQNGKTRKPRYVADRLGNHFVTLRLAPGIRGQIRVDWVTVPTKTGQRYSMPYHFQQSNEFSTVADCNPLFVDIRTDVNGIMKLYLVLIKSKQDALKAAQPLNLFQPLTDSLGGSIKNNYIKSEIMTPKKLIQEFQLEQSQLAFTLCTSTDGKTLRPLWHTMVFSSILTEITTDGPSRQTVACPNCKCSFEVGSNGDDAGEKGISLKSVPKKRKRPADDWQTVPPFVQKIRSSCTVPILCLE